MLREHWAYAYKSQDQDFAELIIVYLMLISSINNQLHIKNLENIKLDKSVTTAQERGMVRQRKLTGMLACTSNFSSSAKTVFISPLSCTSSSLLEAALSLKSNIWGSKNNNPPRGFLWVIYSVIWQPTKKTISMILVELIQPIQERK